VEGFHHCCERRTQHKIHLAAATVVIALGFNFNITSVEWLIILIMIGLVICTELINSSIENLTDLVTQQKNPLAGKVKDIAASAVLVMSILSVVVGLIIFTKYFKELVA